MVLLVKTVRGKVLYHNSPDGGWAWIVLAAGFCIMAIIFSVVRSLGIFYNDFKEHYGATNTQTSWIWAIATSMFGLASPIGGMLIRVFDSRRILMLSGILCCVGMIITLLATHLWMVYVGIGVIWGCGFSWSYISIITQINIYFFRWRSLANGVMAGGSAVGAAVMPLLIEALREIYGWRGTMFILAGIALNICMFAALMRPISVVNATDLPKYRDLPYADVATNPDELQAMTVSREVLDYIEKADDVEVVTQASFGDRVMKFIRDNWLLAWYGLTQFVVGVCVFIPVMFLAPLSKSIGFTGDQAALLLSMTAFGDMVFRPLTGITLSLVRVLERNILFFLTAITLTHAGLCLIPAYGSEFATLSIYAVAYGCLFGCFVPTNTSAFAVLLGNENLTTYMANFFFLSGVASLVSPPIAGYLADVFGNNYRVVYWYAMLCFLLSSLLFLVTGICVRRLGAMLPKHRTTKKENSSRNFESNYD